MAETYEGRTGIEAMEVRLNVLGKSKSWLAEQLGKSRGAISLWKEIPHRHVHTVAALIDLKPEILRPGMFSGVE